MKKLFLILTLTMVGYSYLTATESHDVSSEDECTVKCKDDNDKLGVWANGVCTCRSLYQDR